MASQLAEHLDAPPVVRKWARIIGNCIPDYVLDHDRDEAGFHAAWLIWCADAGELYARLAALDGRHQPRSWRESDVTVCRTCQHAWPCPERVLLDGGEA